MNGERLRVAHVGQVRDELQAVDEATAAVESAGHAKPDDGARTSRQVALRGFVARARRQARIIHPRDLRMLLQPARHRERILRVPLDAKRQGLEPLNKQKRVERRDGRAEIPQQSDARLDDVGEVAQRSERLHEVEPVIALVRAGNQRELSARPVELAAVDDDAADRRAVPADELRCRIHDDVGAVFDGAKQIRRDSVVDDERHARGVRDAGQPVDVGDVELRVADRLGVDSLGAGSDRALEGGEVVRRHEGHLDAEPAQGVMKEIVGAAVEVVGRNDFIAGLRQIEHGQGDRRLPACHGERADPAVERGHALFEYVGRRVHQPRVDVAELLERKQVRRCSVSTIKNNYLS